MLGDSKLIVDSVVQFRLGNVDSFQVHNLSDYTNSVHYMEYHYSLLMVYSTHLLL